jgi:hypothetical protein
MMINVNGQSYSRWEDVPPELRQQLAATLPDADRNGIPDVLEGNLSGLPTGGSTSQTFTSISVNGQQVGSVGELPADVQQVLRQAFGWPAAPGTAAPPAPGAPAAATTPAKAPWPLQPGQVMLNGVPTSVGEPAGPKKPWWQRLFGG